ncbi:MAG TPA: radical SAM protein [Deltaproteobacteria bacterium]|nr:radical SAM protein [Deltaproteobacteria bacterium]
MKSAGKILLVNPDWQGIRRQKQAQFKRIWQPLDLANAAALLEEKHFTVRILDNNVERVPPESLGILAEGYDKVFVTSTPYDRWQCPSLDIGFFFDTARQIPPERLYLMGAHVTERPQTILQKTRARAAILGEPEQTILELALRDLGAQVPEEIAGIAFFKGSRMITTPARENLPNLDALPFPAYHLLPMDRYFYEFMGNDFAILETSRGCPYRCSFCYLGMYGKVFRRKSLSRILEEMVWVKTQYHVKNIYFMDLEFGLDRDCLLSLCKELTHRDMGIQWCCQTRVTDVDEEVLKWMKTAGCSLIHFGVESGSDRILKQTGKGIKVSDCAKAIAMTRAAGIRTAVFMNFGFPGETKVDMEDTIKLAVRLTPSYASFHLIVPFPGTKIALDANIDSANLPSHLYPHYNKEHDLALLKRMLRKAYCRFYLRPQVLRDFAARNRGHYLNKVKLFFRLLTG